MERKIKLSNIDVFILEKEKLFFFLFFLFLLSFVCVCVSDDNAGELLLFMLFLSYFHCVNTKRDAIVIYAIVNLIPILQ